MIREMSGDLLGVPAEALVNPVNTVGVMGKGLALEFRRVYPEMYEAYREAARNGELEVGRMWVWEVEGVGLRLGGPRWVINFPTKKDWREASRMEWIEEGLVNLIEVVDELGIGVVAVPALGCGLGGLAWEDVRAATMKAFEGLNDVTALLFSPG